MQFVQALIATVGEQFEALVQLKFALFVEREIVCRTTSVCRTNHLPGAPVDDYL